MERRRTTPKEKFGECDRCAGVFLIEHLVHLSKPSDLIVCTDCLTELADEGEEIAYATKP